LVTVVEPTARRRGPPRPLIDRWWEEALRAGADEDHRKDFEARPA
jgi:hypothetical protein